MPSFSDAEEIEFGTADNAPWLLATTLRKYVTILVVKIGAII